MVVHWLGSAGSAPTALHIYRELRREAVRFYILTFKESYSHPTTCVDPYFDTILFRHVNLFCLDLIWFLKGHLGIDKITSIAFRQELCREIIQYLKLNCYVVTESLSETKEKITRLKGSVLHQACGRSSLRRLKHRQV